jgi:hypothetical protein
VPSKEPKVADPVPGRPLADRPAATPELSWAQVSARRLEQHGLSAPLPRADPAGVAAAICGAHAQMISAAELSLALRLEHATVGDVRDALWRDHTLIKTVGPRGTVHLVAAADLPMWLAVLSSVPRPARQPPPGPGPAEGTEPAAQPPPTLTSEQTSLVVEAIDAALTDAELTIDELGQQVVAATGPWAGHQVMPAFGQAWSRWRQAIDAAAHAGVLCWGPSRGRQVTYTNPRRWLPDLSPPPSPAEALASFVHRYLQAYGPATSRHFARWLAAPQQWAADLFESMSGQLRQVTLAGNAAWLSAEDAVRPSATPDTLHLLPYFDAYVVAGQPRDLLFPAQAATRALAHGQAGNFPVILIDGTVAGVWHHRRSARVVHLTVEPFADLTRVQLNELRRPADRVGRILGLAPELSIGPVKVGPHG